MAVVEGLRENKKFGLVGGIVLICVAAAAITYEVWPTSTLSGGTRTFFSDDDGATYFVDSIYKFPPFDHNGKTAYRAAVYDSDRGKFVAYLYRLKPDAKKKLEDAYAKAISAGQPLTTIDTMMIADQIRFGGTEMKRPGDTQWINATPYPPPVKNSPGGTKAYYQVQP